MRCRGVIFPQSLYVLQAKMDLKTVKVWNSFEWFKIPYTRMTSTSIFTCREWLSFDSWFNFSRRLIGFWPTYQNDVSWITSIILSLLSLCGLGLTEPISLKHFWICISYISSILSIVAEENPCNSNNGGCEHYCHYEDRSLRCSCAVGFALQNDRRSCKGENYLE